MKRSPLQRRKPLRRSRPVAVSPRLADPERAAWKQPQYGRCDPCGLLSDERALHGHHVVSRQYLARAGFSEFDPRNRMNLCETCHLNHEFGQTNRKIPIEKVPEQAVAFAVDVLGEDIAVLYFMRHYGCGESL